MIRISNKNLNNFLGLYSEYLVILFLLRQNYMPKKWRYKNEFGEIDLIAINIQKREIIFCEVKFRSDNSHLNEALSEKQLQRIYNAGEFYISSNPQYKNYDMPIYLFLISEKIEQIRIA